MSPEPQNSEQNQILNEDAIAPSAESAATYGAPPAPDVQTQLAALQEQILRARADAENTRRRAEEEVAKARKFAVESFAESLLPVKDSLEAAIASTASLAAEGNAPPSQWLEGVHATLRQLSAALERNKVIEINPAQGQKFDPHHHQAISVVPAPAESNQEANTIVSVLQKGYLIADRVLRPALVTVSAPK